MTNVQLIFGIAIPGFLVILAWISNNSKLDRVDKRMDSFEKRMDENRDANHRDALEIMRSMTALHERVAIVESKQDRS